jgi:hypothetical protein
MGSHTSNKQLSHGPHAVAEPQLTDALHLGGGGHVAQQVRPRVLSSWACPVGRRGGGGYLAALCPRSKWAAHSVAWRAPPSGCLSPRAALCPHARQVFDHTADLQGAKGIRALMAHLAQLFSLAPISRSVLRPMHAPVSLRPGYKHYLAGEPQDEPGAGREAQPGAGPQGPGPQGRGLPEAGAAPAGAELLSTWGACPGWRLGTGTGADGGPRQWPQQKAHAHVAGAEPAGLACTLVGLRPENKQGLASAPLDGPGPDGGRQGGGEAQGPGPQGAAATGQGTACVGPGMWDLDALSAG